MASLKDEVEELIGVRPKTWGLYGGETEPMYARLRFVHTPSKDKPEGQPLSWRQIQKLDYEYDIREIQSESDGRTGSALCVTINDP